MAVVRYWLVLEARRRWRQLAMLGLLIGFTAGVVLASGAGAFRGNSAADRLAVATKAATVDLHPFAPDGRFNAGTPLWDRIRALPSVEALTVFPALAFPVDGVPDTRTGLTMAPGDSALLHTIEVPVILAGRLPDPGRADEVVITPLFQQAHAKGVGDTVTLRLLSPAQAMAPGRMGNHFAPAGPAVRARIVGVIRSAWFCDSAGGSGGVIASPALFAQYRGNIIGSPDTIPIEALVRLRGGAASIPAFHRDLDRLAGMEVNVQDLDATVAVHRRLLDGLEASALLVFTGAAALASVVLVGQAVVRYCGAAAVELRTLRALGMTLRQQVLLASAGPAIAGTAGTVVGVAGAIAASNWMPIGSAALQEPDPGISVDGWILGFGGVAVVVLVALGAAAATLVALSRRADAPERRSAIARAAVRAGLAVPVVVGMRFALEPGRGERAVAVRPALTSAVVAVIGVVMTFTFAAGVADAAHHPARFGQTQDLEVYLGYGDDTVAPSAAVLAAVARDPAVAAVNDARIQFVQAAGLTFSLYTYHPVGGPLPAVLSQGRLPEQPDEIALGWSTARHAALRVGDRLQAGSVSLTVTGIGFLPSGLENAYTAGGWVTPEGYARVFGGSSFFWHVAEIALRPGADRAAVSARLQKVVAGFPGGDRVTVVPPVSPPQELTEITDLAMLPYLLGTFLIVLAAGAAGHALATAVRRRRHELGVLRALGMTRPQARLVVLTQALVLAVFGLLPGIPLGFALGRTVWRLTADSLPVSYLPPWAPWTLALIAPVTVLTALLLAAVPSRTAARLGVAQVLRAG